MTTTATPSASFTRPADATAYASGDLVANSTTAGSVTPMSWSVTGNGDIRANLQVVRARISKTTNTTSGASFRVHLYASSPTVSNGDNGAWLSTLSGYFGSLDVTIAKAFSDPGAIDEGIPTTGTSIIIPASTELTIYGLLEARGSYTPGSAEVFTVTLETLIS